jgi:hypothetical protein
LIFNNVWKRSSLGALPILLLCFCILFSSCANSQSGVNDHSLYLPHTEDSFPSEKTEFFYFIIPKDASAELAQSAKELCKRFCSENGAQAQVYFDNEVLPTYENARFILLGDTAHPSSQKAISHLKRDDYVCLSIEKDVIIGGKSSSATVLAIERFEKDVLPYFDGESGISGACSFEYFADYGQEDIKINGYSLSDYTFVYPSENSINEFELAYLLREKLADICGAYPRMISDKEADASDRLICIGNCFNETRPKAQILCQNKSVRLFASSSNLLAKAINTLIKTCESSPEVMLRDQTLIDINVPAISCMSVIQKKIEGESDLAGIVSVCKEIKQILPMLVCFDLPSDIETLQYEKNLNEYTKIGDCLFILSNKNEIISRETVGNISRADISAGEGFNYRVIVADTRGEANAQETLASALSKISDGVTTFLFTISSGAEKPSFERDDIILELESSDGDILIHTSVFAPIGAASAQGQTVILNHSLLKEALSE